MNAVPGEEQLLMSDSGSLSEDMSWTTDFVAEHPAMMYLKVFTEDYSYAWFVLTIVDKNMGEIIYEKEDKIDNDTSFDDAIGLDPGHYSVTIMNNGYTSRSYDFIASYQYLYTDADPFYALDNQGLTIYTGKTKKLKPQIIPETAPIESITWTSNNPSIATVDQNGVVTGIAKGSTVIKANIDGNICTCKVTVKKPSYSINTSSVTLYQKKTKQLKVTVSPSSYGLTGLEWKSSNPKVATVNSKGLVTAKAKGTATITASVNGVSKTCKVTVKEMKINKKETTVYVKKTKTLEIYGGTGKTTWKSSNPKVATVTSKGVVKGVKPGTATITGTKNGKKFKCKVTVKWEPETGITFTKTYTVSYSKDADINMKGSGKITLTIKNTDSGSYADNLNVYIYNPKFNNVLDVSVAPDKTKTVSINTSLKGDYSLSCYGYGKVTVKKTTKPTLSKSSMTIGKGYTGSLKVYGVKNGGTWSSSNKSIATVTSKGIVKGKKKGTCYIKYTLKTGKMIKCKVTVTNPVTCKVTSVSDVAIYNDCNIKFTNYTNKKITYIELNIKQYDNKGSRLYDGPYDWYYVNDTLPAKSSDTWEFWVHDDAKKCTAYITKVYYSDGTTWTP